MKQLWTVTITRSRADDPEWYSDLVQTVTAYMEPTTDEVSDLLRDLLPDLDICEDYLSLEEQIQPDDHNTFEVYFQPTDDPEPWGYVATFYT